ncbi:hypothetical protein SEA_DATBOI_136 [Gordonia phage DatBoi]|nr:hypothetical protein SEA_DATBOI_136 [Gordonia phage DatBoi]
MSCSHDDVDIVLYESPWGHSEAPLAAWEGLIKTNYEHIATSALSGRLVRAEGNVEAGQYVIDDGEALLHFTWFTRDGVECELHREGCICECCDPVDRNVVGGDFAAEARA